MTCYRDRQIRQYHLFLIFFLCLLAAAGSIFYMQQTNDIKSMFLSHDSAVISSLLEQGVEEAVIANAVTSTVSTQAGTDFMTRIGITMDTQNRFLPFPDAMQHRTAAGLLITGLLLSVILLGGTCLFFRKREQLYQQAADIVKHYIDGDYSHHLPQADEGTIYQIFASVVQLSTMLQAKNEAEHKAKEFLKSSISDISHQLKTPLAALTMYQEIVESEPDNLETVREFTAKTGIALARMEQLIQSLLKITRLDAGNIHFETNPIRIPDLLSHAVNELTTRAKREHKELILDGPPEEMLVCDRDWTGEAIGNIVKNALDHTGTGGIIRISWERSPTMMRIQIADNGNGIAPEDIHHIFKRFYRSKNSLDTQGVGLGLPLAKSIIEGQGGVLSVQSSPDRGTVFSVSFLTKL